VDLAPDTGALAPEPARRRPWADPRLIQYLMGPPALLTLLVVGHFHLIARRSAWEWVAVFAAIPSLSLLVDELRRRHPTRLVANVRLALHVAAVTTVIYLSGWGPVLVGGFAFVALGHVNEEGSTVWRRTAAYSLAGIAAGQVGIAQGWLPSLLSFDRAEALGVMSTFVLLFVIRMAGAAMAEKEAAEASTVASEERFRSLVQHSSDTTIVVGPSRTVTWVSPAVQSLLGTAPEDVVGRADLELVHPDDREKMATQLGARLAAGNDVEPAQFRMVRADGTTRHVEAVVTDLRAQPSVGGYVVNVRDITDRKEAEDQLAHQALHDPLTGLPNRTLVMDRAQQMLVRARRERQPVAAFFLDLDNFKDINDSLGHEAGDRVLQAVAGRLSGILRASDTVGRLGGDEFVVLAEGFSLAAGPELLAERIRDVLKEPIRVAGFDEATLRVAASIGIAGGEHRSAQELLRAADIALYRAKADGKDCYAAFVQEMETEVLSELALRMDLQSALAEDAYFLLYQPVYDLATLEVCGVEALLRWRHPVRGVLAPDTFIPMLEESGHIVEVGRWVLDTACRQAAAWHGRGHRLSMSVNVSTRQLGSDAIVDHVRQALDASGLPAEDLVIEITETALMRDADAAADRLRALKDIGVQVAIDDFGTGYSSLAYLRQFPVDALKIDRSFVTGVVESPESAAIIHTLVELGRGLGLGTLAEGIEDPLQLERLRENACERGQGFLFSEPVDAEAIEAMLATAVGSAG
jgi:diguanylate cyclase (GGDEF)-like protein/PAS domain S-box-containing protein